MVVVVDVTVMDMVVVVVDVVVMDMVVVDVAVVDVAVMNMADMDMAVMELVVVDMEVIDKVLVVDMVSGVRVVTKAQWPDTPCAVNILEFSEPVGPSITLGDPTTTFLTLFTPELLNHIVRETNKYDEQCISATRQGDGPPPTWTTTVELRAFIGFAILMGINELPEICDYWSTNDQLHYFPVASRIPRKRFMELSIYLRFSFVVLKVMMSHKNIITPLQTQTGAWAGNVHR